MPIKWQDLLEEEGNNGPNMFQQVQRLILAKKYFGVGGTLNIPPQTKKQQFLNEEYRNIRKPYNIGFSHPSRAFCIVVRYMFDISVAFVVLRRPCFIISSQLSNPFTEVLCKSNSSSIGIEAFPSSVRVATV